MDFLKKITEKIPFLGKFTSKIDNSKNDDNPSSDNKNQKQLIVRGVLILIIAYLAIDYLSQTPQNGEEVSTSTPLENKKDNLNQVAPVETKASSETQPKVELVSDTSPQAPITSEPDIALAPTDLTAPIDTTSIEQNKVEINDNLDLNLDITNPSEAISKEEIKLDQIDAQKTSLGTDPLPELNIDAQKTSSGTDPLPELNTENNENLDVIMDSQAKADSTKQSDIPITEGEVIKEPENLELKMTTDILDDLSKKITSDETQNNMIDDEYISPPDYEYKGRGLVYNCIGKHWACLNGSNYYKCEKNFTFNSKFNKKKECFPVEVYSTDKDCIQAQKNKITSAFNTGFCL